MNNYIESKSFTRTDFTGDKLPKGEYDNCTFVDCDISNADLSGINLVDCTFTGCNLSLARISNTAFREVRFVECKLMGLHFENCNPFLFSIEVERCSLNLSSFYKLNLKRSKFKSTTLQEVDFTESDLTGVALTECDLSGAIFENTNLEKADFRAAYNYSIDPENNRLKKAKFSREGIAGLLGKYGIEVE